MLHHWREGKGKMVFNLSLLHKMIKMNKKLSSAKKTTQVIFI
jgi:hypothetical protein